MAADTPPLSIVPKLEGTQVSLEAIELVNEARKRLASGESQSVVLLEFNAAGEVRVESSKQLEAYKVLFALQLMQHQIMTQLASTHDP